MVLPVRQGSNSGLIEVNGLLRVQEDSLILEFRLQDEVLGIFNSDVKISKIPFDIIESIEIERDWFIWKFNIYLNSFPRIQKQINIKDNCLSLSIKRVNVEKARNFRSRVMLDISEQKLNKLDEDESPQSPAGAKNNPERIEYRDKGISDDAQEPGGLKNILRNEEGDSS